MTKIRKFFKWLFSIFGTTTVVSMGSGNSTFVSQTTKVTTISSKELNETLNEALCQARQNNERRLKIPRPVPPSPPMRRVVVDDDSLVKSHRRSAKARSSIDDGSMVYIATSSVFASSSDDGGSYSSGDCSSSSSSCD